MCEDKFQNVAQRFQCADFENNRLSYAINMQKCVAKFDEKCELGNSDRYLWYKHIHLPKPWFILRISRFERVVNIHTAAAYRAKFNYTNWTGWRQQTENGCLGSWIFPKVITRNVENQKYQVRLKRKCNFDWLICEKNYDNRVKFNIRQHKLAREWKIYV